MSKTIVGRGIGEVYLVDCGDNVQLLNRFHTGRAAYWRDACASKAVLQTAEYQHLYEHPRVRQDPRVNLELRERARRTAMAALFREGNIHKDKGPRIAPRTKEVTANS